jgi:hypothetical protein
MKMLLWAILRSFATLVGVGLLLPALVFGQETGSLRADVSGDLPKEGSPKLNVLFKTGFAEYTDSSDEQTAALLRVESDFIYPFSRELQLHSDVDLALLSQRVQQDIPTSDAFESGFRLKQVVLTYKPVAFADLNAGVVNQRRSFTDIPFLVDDRGFPGLMQNVHFGDEDLQLTGFLEQGIPTSTSLDTDRVQKEALPMYFSEGLKLNWKPNDTVTISPYVLHYAFYDLPSVAAADSANLGNDIINAGETNAAFQYHFDGFVVGTSADWWVQSHWKLNVEYQALRNFQAPSNLGAGALLVGRSCFCYSSIKVTPGVLVFYNEADTAPAVYNDGRFGHNNRQGQGAELKVELPNWKFSTVGRFINSDVINDEPNHQSHAQYFEIFLETNHVDIL